jgi:ribosomal protein S18 acetylase RimI-like enzyme
MTTSSAPPYPSGSEDLGRLPDGRALSLHPITPDAARTIGTALATFGPWAHYGTRGEVITAALATTYGGTVRYSAHVDGALAGAIVIRSPWLIGPYLQLLAVMPGFQGQKIGDRLLAWFEGIARDDGARQVWLCVTGANTGAQRFYRSHGWIDETRLADLIKDGEDEILMRKWLVARPAE